MAHALLLHIVVTGAPAVVLSGLVSAQWLLTRLAERARASQDRPGKPAASAMAATAATAATAASSTA